MNIDPKEDVIRRKLNFTYPLKSIYDLLYGEYSIRDIVNLVYRSSINCLEYTLDRFYREYSFMSSFTLNTLSSIINERRLLYLGYHNAFEDNKDYKFEWYFSMMDHHIYELKISDDFYKSSVSVQNPNDVISFNILTYDVALRTLNALTDDTIEFRVDTFDDVAHESALYDDDFDDLYYLANEAEVTEPGTTTSTQSTGDDDPLAGAFGNGTDTTTTGGETNAGSSDAGGGIEDLTKTTSDSLGMDDNSGDSSDGDLNSDASDAFGDSPDDADALGAPDDKDEEMDDSDEDSDDEGTEAKRRIRNNLVKLHTIIKDSLAAMDTFTPTYNVASAKKYYKIQSNLITADNILIEICLNRINDITVDELEKKYLTLCNIYDISSRALRAFANEYKKEAELRGKAIRKKSNKNDGETKTGNIQ